MFIVIAVVASCLISYGCDLSVSASIGVGMMCGLIGGYLEFRSAY